MGILEIFDKSAAAQMDRPDIVQPVKIVYMLMS